VSSPECLHTTNTSVAYLHVNKTKCLKYIHKSTRFQWLELYTETVTIITGGIVVQHRVNSDISSRW